MGDTMADSVDAFHSEPPEDVGDALHRASDVAALRGSPFVRFAVTEPVVTLAVAETVERSLEDFASAWISQEDAELQARTSGIEHKYSHGILLPAQRREAPVLDAYSASLISIKPEGV